ncbi:MAG: ankyrin repeat domain-containing protein [Shewanella sp.]|nr:ankyrin repeat domain-containing protein [Shewanella sp.]
MIGAFRPKLAWPNNKALRQNTNKSPSTNRDAHPPLSVFQHTLSSCENLSDFLQVCAFNSQEDIGESLSQIAVERRDANAKELQYQVSTNSRVHRKILRWILDETDTNLAEDVVNILNTPNVTAAFFKKLACLGKLNSCDERLLDPNVIEFMEPGLIHQQLSSQSLEIVMLRSIAQDNTVAVRKLFNAGVSTKRKHNFEFPWLHTCVLNNSLNVLAEFLSYLTELNTLDNTGNTALHIACIHNHAKAVSLLLESPSVDPDIIDADGNTALNVAAASQSWHCLNVLINSTKINLFSTNHSNSDVLTLLMKEHQPDIVSVLIKNQQIKLNTRHILIAVHFNNIPALRAVLQHAPKLLKSVEAEVLIVAVSHGFYEIVETLIEYGANITVKDDRGYTAFHSACEHSYPDIINLLFQHPKSYDFYTPKIKVQLHSIASRAVERANKQIGICEDKNLQHLKKLENAKATVILLSKYN